MEGYLRAASQISRLAVGDRNASADVGHLQDRPHRVADAPRRRRADRHARRHLGRAHLPGRRRLRRSRCRCTTSRSAASTAALDGDDGHQRADRGVGQRRARGAARHQPADERDRSQERPRASRRRRFTSRPGRSACRPRSSSASTARSTTCSRRSRTRWPTCNISFGVTALPHMRDLTIVGPSHGHRRVRHGRAAGRSSPAGRRRANEEETCAAEIVKRLDRRRRTAAPATRRRPAGR